MKKVYILYIFIGCVWMMVIAPNSLVRQKEGLRGRKRWEVEERDDPQQLRRQARTLPQVQLGQGCRM